MPEQTDISPAEAQELEAAQGHFLTVPFGDGKWEIVPPGAWRQSWLRQLKNGDMDDFMQSVLSPDSYDLYLDADPTTDELGEFLTKAGDAAGEALGKSSGPRRSLNGSRRK